MADIRRSAVLDDCQRANEHPLAGPTGVEWGKVGVGGSSFWGTDGHVGGLCLVDNVIGNHGVVPDSRQGAYWKPLIAHDPCEVWARSAAGFDLSEAWHLFLALQRPDGTNVKGYMASMVVPVGPDIWAIARLDDVFSSTLLVSVPQGPLGDNELALFRLDAGVLSLWRDNGTNGASWSLVCSASDSTYTFGHLGLGTDQDDDNPGWREFGGGEILYTQVFRVSTWEA
jgi:hypothetical protein